MLIIISANIYLFVNFHKHDLSAFFVSDTIVGPRNIAMNMADKAIIYMPMEEIFNKQI